MTNAPTNSAIPPKTSSAVRKKPNSSSRSAACCAASSAPVRTVTGCAGERDAHARCAACAGADALGRGDGDPVELAAPARQRLRRLERRDRDRVAGDRVTSPKLRRADELVARAPSSPTIFTRSPSLKPCSSKVFWSRPISDAVRGARPVDEAKLLERRGLQRRDEALVADRVAVALADRDVAEDDAGGRGDAVGGGDALEQALVERRRVGVEVLVDLRGRRSRRRCRCWPARRPR